MLRKTFGNRWTENLWRKSAKRAGVVSFNLEGVGIASDVGMILDKLGIAVRTGHHCTQPIMDFFQCSRNGELVCSFNTLEEIDALAEGVKSTKEC